MLQKRSLQGKERNE
uniref:Uncharacterized protein n=1 Tax=Arundo donax TaxID=35708 RepID=A0A0A9AYY4_ARUDO